MKRVTVTAPDDTRWTVRVVWEPRWRAMARRFGGWRRSRKGKSDGAAADLIDGALQAGSTPRGRSSGGSGDSDGFDLGDAMIVIVVICIVFIAAAVMFWWVLLPLLLLVADALIVLVLLAAALTGRIFFRRPCTVEATANSGATLTADVVGWRAALRRRDEVAESLRLGAPRP